MPKIVKIQPLYHCDRVCRVCGWINSDTMVEVRYDTFKANNLRFDVHKSCIEGMDHQQIMTTLKCIQTFFPEKEAFMSWRLGLVQAGHARAKINLLIKQGKLTPLQGMTDM